LPHPDDRFQRAAGSGVREIFEPDRRAEVTLVEAKERRLVSRSGYFALQQNVFAAS
jgi:urease beta subunit